MFGEFEASERKVSMRRESLAGEGYEKRAVLITIVHPTPSRVFPGSSIHGGQLRLLGLDLCVDGVWNVGGGMGRLT